MADTYNTDAAATPEPRSPDPRSGEMVRAFFSGNREDAQKLLNERTATPDDNLPPPLSGDAKVEPVPAETIDTAAQDLIALGGEHLVREWGGAGSADFKENLAYAHYAAGALSPQALAHFMTPVESADGTTYVPGDDPSIIKLAAQVGRLLAHREGVEVSPARKGKPMTRSSTVDFSTLNSPINARGDGGGLHTEMNRLTKAIHAAQARGDRDEMRALDRERNALAQRAYGGQPIVGQGGRNV